MSGTPPLIGQAAGAQAPDPFFDNSPAQVAAPTTEPLLAQASGPAAPVSNMGMSMITAQAPAQAPAADPAALRAQVVPDAIRTIPEGGVPTSEQATALASLPASWQGPVANAYGLGMVKTGETQTSGSTRTVLPEEAKQAFRDSDQGRVEMSKTRMQLGAAEAEAAVAEAAMREKQVAELQAFSAAEDARMVAHQERMSTLQVKADEKQAAALEAAKNVEPGRIMTGFGGVFASIMAGLGAFAATIGRTENFAQGVIDRAIERDWQSQKDFVKALDKDATVSQQQVAAAREMFQDVTAQKQYYRSNMLAIGASQLEALAGKHKGTQLEQRALLDAQNMWAASKQARGESFARESVTTQNSSSSTLQIGGGAAGAGTGGVKDTLLGKAKEIAQAEKDIALARQPVLNDKQETVQEETLTEATQLGSSLQDANDLLKLIKQANLAGARAPMVFDNDTNIQRATNLFMNPILRKMSGAAISNNDLERYSSAIGQGSGSWRSKEVQAGLEKFVNSALREAQHRMNLLPEQTRDLAWKRLEHAMGDDVSAYRSLRNGKWDTAAESAAQVGVTLRR